MTDDYVQLRSFACAKGGHTVCSQIKTPRIFSVLDDSERIILLVEQGGSDGHFLRAEDENLR